MTETIETTDNDVGYKKPPKQHRFQKGVSGNPRGRKKKPRDAEGLLKLELDKLITIREGGQEVRITKLEAMITALVNDAITGKGKARDLLIRILDVTNLPEPFTPNEDDHALLDQLLKKRREL